MNDYFKIGLELRRQRQFRSCYAYMTANGVSMERRLMIHTLLREVNAALAHERSRLPAITERKITRGDINGWCGFVGRANRRMAVKLYGTKYVRQELERRAQRYLEQKEKND